MSRLLFLSVVIAIVYWLLKSYRKQLLGKGAPKISDHGEGASGQAENMVLCVHCGVHLPKRESIQTGGKFYCSEAHRHTHTGKPE